MPNSLRLGQFIIEISPGDRAEKVIFQLPVLSAVTSSPDLQSIKGKNLRNALNGYGANTAPFCGSGQAVQTSASLFPESRLRAEMQPGQVLSLLERTCQCGSSL